MKHKRITIHPLEFAKRMVGDGSTPYLKDMKLCEEAFQKASQQLIKDGWINNKKEANRMAHAAFTLADWIKYKQVYRPTKELAEDLFAMDDLSFPLSSVHLPFPSIYIDVSELELETMNGAYPLGIFLTISEIPYGENYKACCCSLVTLGWDGTDYVFGGITFDYEAELTEKLLGEVVENLTRKFPEERVLLKDALLFAAYLSSAKPDISEDENQKSYYRPSVKPKASSVRNWDVGVRYMTEKRKSQSVSSENVTGKSHQSPRPHIRKAHWHTYYIGVGRKEKKLLWMPPVLVGAKGKEPTPVVIRKTD